MSNGIVADDAMIAATAIENGYPLLSGNKKHYKPVRELDFRLFIP